MTSPPRVTSQPKGRRRTAIAGLLTAVLCLGGLAAAAAPASAATTHPPATHAVRHDARPYSAQGCNGDVCIYLSTPSGGHVYIQAWAYSQSFYGYFHLSGPNGLSKNSSTKTWIGGKGNYYQWNGITATVGKYCITGYSYGKNIGKPCENIE